jgi:2-C-methyl-D-erythritol 2,4-cyclodiphosphate synthase
MRPPRIGLGYDSHRFEEGRRLVLGGVPIPFPRGLAGHSDADVLLHAVIDALLGAASAGDIGALFPDTDEASKNISSIKMLGRALEEVRRRGYRVGNVDAVVLAEEPRIAPHREAIRRSLALALGIGEDDVSVKGKTNEGMGSIGRGEGIAVHAAVIVLDEKDKGRKSV